MHCVVAEGGEYKIGVHSSSTQFGCSRSNDGWINCRGLKYNMYVRYTVTVCTIQVTNGVKANVPCRECLMLVCMYVYVQGRFGLPTI